MDEKLKRLVKECLLMVRDNGLPKEFPEVYRRGYADGVSAALRVLDNVDFLEDSLKEDEK